MRILAIVLSLFVIGIAPASAHVSISHVFSFATGFRHPLSGLDHIAAMVAVGVWAAIAGGRRLYAWPLAFVAAMLAGGALAHEGIAIPYTEPAIAASAVILGLAVALYLKLPVFAGALFVACFGIAHGYAHGLEAPSSDWGGYAAGFVLATALLHAVGIGIGVAIPRFAGTGAVRSIGVLTAAAGLAIFYQQ